MAFLGMALPTGRGGRRRLWGGSSNEPEPASNGKLAHPIIAITPLIVVGVMNKVLTVRLRDITAQRTKWLCPE